MEIDHSTKDGCLVVALTGSIDLFSVSVVQRTLRKDLADQPDALICDLSAASRPCPASGSRLRAARS